VSVFLAPLGTDIQTFCALAVVVAALTLHINAKPYTDARLVRVEGTSLFTCFLTLFGGLFFFSPNAGQGLRVFFTLAIASVNILWLLYFIMTMWKAVRKDAKKKLLAARMKIHAALNHVRHSLANSNDNDTGSVGTNRVSSNPLAQRDVTTLENPIVRQADINRRFSRPSVSVHRNPLHGGDEVSIEMTRLSPINPHQLRGGGQKPVPTPRVTTPVPTPLSKNSGGTRSKNKTKKVKPSRRMRPKQQIPLEKTVAQQKRREKLRSLHTKRQSLDATSSEIGVFYNHPSKVKRNPSPVEKPVQKNEEDTRDTVWKLPEDGDVVAEDNGFQQDDKIEEDGESFFESVETGNRFWETPEDGGGGVDGESTGMVNVVVEDQCTDERPSTLELLNAESPWSK